jgi:hypothetical protein
LAVNFLAAVHIAAIVSYWLRVRTLALLWQIMGSDPMTAMRAQRRWWLSEGLDDGR